VVDGLQRRGVETALRRTRPTIVGQPANESNADRYALGSFKI